MRLRKPYKPESTRYAIKSHQLSWTHEEPLSLLSVHSRTPSPDGGHKTPETVAVGLETGARRGKELYLTNLSTPAPAWALTTTWESPREGAPGFLWVCCLAVSRLLTHSLRECELQAYTFCKVNGGNPRDLMWSKVSTPLDPL